MTVQNRLKPARVLLRWLIALTALLLLALSPVVFDDQHTPEYLVLGLAAALAMNLGLVTTNRRIHGTYAIGILTVLLLGSRDNWGTPLLVTGIGGWAGAVILVLSQRDELSLLNTLRETLQLAGQVVLATAAGLGMYVLLDGELPLQQVGYGDILSLAAFAITSLVAYLVLLRLATQFDGVQPSLQTILRLFGLSLAGILLLPLPIVVAAADSYYQIAPAAFYMALAVLLVILAGISIYNRQQHRADQKVRELTRLTRFGNSIRTSLDLETLLQTVYIQVSHLMSIDNFMVVLQDRETSRFEYLIAVEGGRATSAPKENPFEKQLLTVISENRPLLIDSDKPSGIVSWLGVPIAASDRTRGVMVVYSRDPKRHLKNDDRRRLSVIAGQIGVAIDNALLYEHSRTQAQQLRDLTDVSAELSATLDAKTVLDTIAWAAKKVMNADGAALYIWADNNSNLQLARAVSMSEGFAMMPPAPMLATRPDEDIFVVMDAQSDKRVNDVWLTLTNEGKRAWIETRLHNAEEKLGVLVVYYNEPRSISQQDREILQTFVSQAALAMSNARLYSSKEADLTRRVDQLSLLQRLSQALFLTTLKLSEMYELVLTRAIEGTEADQGVLFLTREETPYCVAQSGYPTNEIAETATTQLVNEVFRTGEMVLVSDTKVEQQFSARPDIRSQMALPILHDIRVIGAILLESREPQAFGPEDMFFVMQVGTQARIAIDNIKLIQNIAATRDRLQAILNSMREGILMVSPEGEITIANPPIRQLLGVTTNQIVGRNLDQVLNVADIAMRLGFEPSNLVDYVKSLKDGTWHPTGVRSEFSVHDGSKQRFFDRVDIPVVASDERTAWLMVFFDMTEEKELEQSRQDLSHMIVHDLRGPLTAINMGLKLMSGVAEREEGPLSQTVLRTADTSQRAVRKMLNLVNSILDIAKMESGVLDLEREPANLASIADSVLEEMQPLADEMKVAMVNKIDPQLTPVDIDPEKVERTLLNLVDNALKFTPTQGKIELQAEPNGGDMLKVSVVDTGPGVPDTHKESLFDRFAMVSSQQGSRRGTGLGLTFCKLTVEAHGGKIWVEDNPDGGAIFSLTIPLVKGYALEAHE